MTVLFHSFALSSSFERSPSNVLFWKAVCHSFPSPVTFIHWNQWSIDNYPTVDEVIEIFDHHRADQVGVGDQKIRSGSIEDADHFAVASEQAQVVVGRFLRWLNQWSEDSHQTASRRTYSLPQTPNVAEKWNWFRSRYTLSDEVLKVLRRPSQNWNRPCIKNILTIIDILI